MNLEIQPLTTVIGAIVSNADLTQLDDESFEKIEQALVDHQVIFFRDQPELSPQTLIAFARRFGELHAHPAAPHHELHPEVFEIHTHENSIIANGNGWHADVSCDKQPPLATMLQLHVLPKVGGDTLFASMYAAFETLSISSGESRALLDFLYRHQQRPEFQVRFNWTKNAIAIWDNRCTQHFALWDYWPEERQGHRVTIKGEVPYFKSGPFVKRDMKLASKL